MRLSLYNSRTRTKEAFVPLDPGHVTMYVCGPTVYDRAHLGNARPVVVFDILYRLLRDMYPNVTYVRNITDVDDKIYDAAYRNGETIDALTQRMTRMFHQDTALLGALPPDVEPRATAHIDHMIRLIETLIARGAAYANAGHVLFRVAGFGGYGNLSRRSPDELEAGARVEVAPYKENAGDFVLWKPAMVIDGVEQQAWDSPWGRGRPGWHIECSAMSEAYLGIPFDIHGGGIDLIFPHHENETAQSCAAHGCETMANWWLHNGHLTVNGQKMSKSLGNFITVEELAKDWPGETIRYALLSTHYRQPLDFNLAATMRQAQQALDALYGVLERAKTEAEDLCETASAQETAKPSAVLEALCDDLNTPAALHTLHAAAHAYNTAAVSERPAAARYLRSEARLTGLLEHEPSSWFHQGSRLDAQEIERYILLRKEARERRDFAESDRIRDLLAAHDISLEDGTAGTLWRVMRK